MEETKNVNAVVENKEDDMGLTTQNQDVPKSEKEWNKAKKMAAKADHKDDFEYTTVIYNQLMAKEKVKEAEPTKDEEINAVGADVPTVDKPEPMTATRAAKKIKNAPELVHRECIDRAAIIFLAKTLLTSTDLEDFKTLYPSLF